MFCAMEWVGRHKLPTFTPEFAWFNEFQLLGYSCTLCMQLFLGESIQRVDCVASFSGCHLAFCCLLKQQSDRKLSGVCMGTRLLRLWVAKEFAARQSHVALFPSQSQRSDRLQHGEGLEEFHMIDMNCCCSDYNLDYWAPCIALRASRSVAQHLKCL